MVCDLQHIFGLANGRKHMRAAGFMLRTAVLFPQFFATDIIWHGEQRAVFNLGIFCISVIIYWLL